MTGESQGPVAALVTPSYFTFNSHSCRLLLNFQGRKSCNRLCLHCWCWHPEMKTVVPKQLRCVRLCSNSRLPSKRHKGVDRAHYLYFLSVDWCNYHFSVEINDGVNDRDHHQEFATVVALCVCELWLVMMRVIFKRLAASSSYLIPSTRKCSR